VAAAIDFNVTVINNEEVRVAGTGPYTKKTRNKIAHGTVFNRIISKRETVIMGNRGSLTVGFIAVGFSFLIGVLRGSVAGLTGGKI